MSDLERRVEENITQELTQRDRVNTNTQDPPDIQVVMIQSHGNRSISHLILECTWNLNTHNLLISALCQFPQLESILQRSESIASQHHRPILVQRDFLRSDKGTSESLLIHENALSISIQICLNHLSVIFTFSLTLKQFKDASAQLEHTSV